VKILLRLHKDKYQITKDKMNAISIIMLTIILTCLRRKINELN